MLKSPSLPARSSPLSPRPSISWMWPPWRTTKLFRNTKRRSLKRWSNRLVLHHQGDCKLNALHLHWHVVNFKPPPLLGQKQWRQLGHLPVGLWRWSQPPSAAEWASSCALGRRARDWGERHWLDLNVYLLLNIFLLRHSKWNCITTRLWWLREYKVECIPYV